MWLDYDYGLTADILGDIAGTMEVLCPGSIFIITVDGRAKLPDDLDDPLMSPAEREREILEYWRRTLGRLVEGEVTGEHLARNETTKLYARAIVRQIRESLLGRDGVEYIQLFNCQYADGAVMLTVGGVIDTPEQATRVADCGILELPFINQSIQPIEISVPPLTIREKQWIDSKLHEGLRPSQLCFELREELFENYRRYYRDYPTYMEALM